MGKPAGGRDGRRKALAMALPSELAKVFGTWLPRDWNFGAAVRERVFPPARVFWLFLSQVLSADGSCREAVQKLAAARSRGGGPRISPRTSGYCQARQRLSFSAILGAHRQVVKRIEAQGSALGLWLGRVVKVVDGSCLSMPDTAANQARWPQQRAQKPGCGFPVMRLVAVFNWATGALLTWAAGDYHTAELTLFRRRWGTVRAGEVLLGDRNFCGYLLWSLLVDRGVDLVVRKAEKRSHSPRVIERLGKHDRIVDWRKSPARPDWLSAEQWVRIPDRMPVRELRLFVSRRGFRTRKLTIATSLLDPIPYSAEALAELYRRRWQVELYLCQIKVTMGMDVLRAKSPAMVEKELAMRVIAYNLLRALMLEAAIAGGVKLDRISFQGAVSALRQWAPVLAWAILSSVQRQQIYDDLLYYLARDLVPLRPNRREPRARKRRPKPYQLLTKPRHQFQELSHRGKRQKA